MTDIKAAMKRAKDMAEAQGLDYNDRKYLPVKDRLNIFREEFGIDYGIDTHVHWEGNIVMAAAKITKDGNVLASGSAMVDTMKDDHSAPVETCETFAIGRALACFGLAGTEYASSNEMERVKPQRTERPHSEPRVAKERVVAHGSNDGLSGDQRQFKRDVEDAFPEVGRPSFYIPEENERVLLNKIYEEVDRINDRNTLGQYYTMLGHFLTWAHPEDVKEIKAVFKAKREQVG